MEEIRTIEKDLKKSHDETRHNKEKKVLPLIKDDPSFFYSYAKSFAVVKEGIGPLTDNEGYLTGDEEKMAELLSNQYSSVWSDPATMIRREQMTHFFNCDKEEKDLE